MKIPILIAHRGNINGEFPEFENSPDYLWNALNLGYDIETDIRKINDKMYLGHDFPQYECNILTFPTENCWFHCKDIFSLFELSKPPVDYEDPGLIDIKHHMRINYFFHDSDDFTLTNYNYIWTYPGKSITENSILVMPERVMDIKDLPKLNPQPYAICSDYVQKIADIYYKFNNEIIKKTDP